MFNYITLNTAKLPRIVKRFRARNIFNFAMIIIYD